MWLKSGKSEKTKTDIMATKFEVVQDHNLEAV
jgi:hypothetical protein